MAELVASADVVPASSGSGRRLTDWDTHGDWMVATTVQRTTGDSDGVGAGIEGITKLGPFAVHDTMTFSQWQPPPASPARCVVEHTGRLVRGSGAFEVEDLGDGRSRIVWSEWVQLPLGLTRRDRLARRPTCCCVVPARVAAPPGALVEATR